MMTIDQFIWINNIKPADAIRMTKKSFGMLEHYVIYLGIRNNDHQFVANYTKGVQVISNWELISFLQKLSPDAINRFPGNDLQRQKALERAFSRIGQRAYNLLSNNCEHFKNWVHYGQDSSTQVENFGSKLMIGGLLASIGGASQKNDTFTGLGIIAAIFGAIIYHVETDEIIPIQ